VFPLNVVLRGAIKTRVNVDVYKMGSRGDDVNSWRVNTVGAGLYCCRGFMRVVGVVCIHICYVYRCYVYRCYLKKSKFLYSAVSNS